MRSAEGEVILAEFRELEDAENYLEEKREQESNRMIEKEIADYKAMHGEGWIQQKILEEIFKKSKITAFQSFKLMEL